MSGLKIRMALFWESHHVRGTPIFAISTKNAFFLRFRPDPVLNIYFAGIPFLVKRTARLRSNRPALPCRYTQNLPEKQYDFRGQARRTSTQATRKLGRLFKEKTDGLPPIFFLPLLFLFKIISSAIFSTILSLLYVFNE